MMTRNGNTTNTPNVEPIMDEAFTWLDADLRREYDLARHHNAALVARESSKAKFLRFTNYNPWQAARRLVLYWKFRQECMTSTRWLLPMTGQGDQGCLGQDDAILLRRGFCDYLNRPDTGPLIVFDLCRRQGLGLEEYGGVYLFLSTMIQDEEVQTRGVTVVFVVNSHATDANIGIQAANCVKEGLPVKINRFVVVQNYEPHKEALVDFLAQRCQLELQANYRTVPCHVISSPHSQHDLLQRVRQAGIPKDTLPESCGGSRVTNPSFNPLFQHLFQHGPSLTLQLPLPYSSPDSSSRRRGLDSGKRAVEEMTLSCLSESTGRTLPTTTTTTTGTFDAVTESSNHQRPKSIDEMLSEVRHAMKRCRRTVTKEPAGIDGDDNNLLGTVVTDVALQYRMDVNKCLLLGDVRRQTPSDEAPLAFVEHLDFGCSIADPWNYKIT